MTEPRQPLTRRRFIRITACAAGLGLSDVRAAHAKKQAPAIWRGTALGGLARVEIYHPDTAVALSLTQRSMDELERLERIFSLYRPDSALSALNRDGSIRHPPPDLVVLLSTSLVYQKMTEGAFDPTVQPLWDLYSRHFSTINRDPNGPNGERLKDALSRIGCANISLEEDRISLASGTTLTLNGIAQGYITDRVTELLRTEGVEHSLINLGEIRLIGRDPDGRRWVVGLEDPDRPGATNRTLEIENSAVATSAGYGFRFDQAGRFTHLFDPRTGRSPQLYKSVSVVAPTATAADALSTAFSSMEIDAINRVLGKFGVGAAYVTSGDGQIVLGGASSLVEQQ